MSRSPRSGVRTPSTAPTWRNLRRGLVGYRTADVDRLFAALSAWAEVRQARHDDDLRRLRARIAEYRRREAACAQAIETQRRQVRETRTAVVEYEVAARRAVEAARQRFERQEAELLATLERARGLLEARRALLLLRSSLGGRTEDNDPIAGPRTAARGPAGDVPPDLGAAPTALPQPGAESVSPPRLRRREA